MDINKMEHARVVEVYECPNCGHYFKIAPRCPECGQLVQGKANIEAVIEVIHKWTNGEEVAGIKKPKTLYLINNIIYGTETLILHSEYRTINEEEIKYWEYFGFNIRPEGIGWVVS